MIRFKMKPEAVWISGADEIFDDSELKIYTKKQREELGFLIYPATPELYREVRKKIADSGKGEFEVEIMNEILPNWSGLKDENKQPIPCTEENRLLLFDRGYPRLGRDIVAAANELMSKHEHYENEQKQAQIKNFQTSQSGLSKESRISKKE